MKTIREWRNEEWEKSNKARNQNELQRMARKILANAEKVENYPTPGHSEVNISRVLTCTSSLLPNTEYIIHINGFTVEDIIEMVIS